ncbi:MAG TPA: site-specific integrase, partial [Microbacterium sp.]|nr:site-specific integrase [Microbacterium sp.]
MLRRLVELAQYTSRQYATLADDCIGEIRLGELTTPLVDKVIGKIKQDVGPPTAKSCRSVISSVMNLAVRYGAVMINPIREVERIEVRVKKTPRALSELEIADWLRQLSADDTARRRDLPDLTLFMIATGVRIGEALAVVWDQVDLVGGEVEITHTIIRVKGQGLLRKPTKSSAGERVLGYPSLFWRCSDVGSPRAAGSTCRSSLTPSGASAIRRTPAAGSAMPEEKKRSPGSPHTT